MKSIFVSILVLCTYCLNAQEASFSDDALNEILLTQDNQEITFNEILNTYKGKKILIDFWANWCRDCLEGIPSLKQLQKEKPNLVYLFLSLDKTYESWKHGIRKHNLVGEHYYIASGWKGSALCTSIKLDWIPRYIVIDESSNIIFFKAITTKDEDLLKHL